MLSRHFSPRWLQWVNSESTLTGGLAVAIGGLAALSVWGFKRLIEGMHWIAFDSLGQGLAAFQPWLIVLVPVAGGLIVGGLKHFLIGEERHHGVAGIMEAVALAGGRLRYSRIPAKAVAAAVSIGFGAAVGPEDPSVQMGANWGSFFGQRLRLSDERVRTLVAAGAAGGVAAAFNAPIAGVFFAQEIILGELTGSALGLVVLAAVTSAAATQAIEGAQPAFQIPTYTFHSAWELPLYLGLGLLSGPVAALYVDLIYRFQDLFHHTLRRLPAWLKPALAGLAVGTAGLALPQVFGVGYDSIAAVLQGREAAVSLLLVLAAAKLVLTPLSLGGGFQGGTFAPALFIGAMLGGAYGAFLVPHISRLALQPPAFALVGMAAVLAGAVHAPLTAILLLFEMTRDYHIILPVMLTVSVSLFISRRLRPDSVYALGLARKGVRLERGRDVDVLETLRVNEVMDRQPVSLGDSDPLAEAATRMLTERHHSLTVLNTAGELVGILARQDLDRLLAEGRPEETRRVGDLCTRQLLTAYPDETLNVALQRMSARDVGLLPVIARENPRQLLGVLRRIDMIRAYDAALIRRTELRHRAQQVRLGALSSLKSGNVIIEDYLVQAGAPAAHRPISASPWPRACLIATLRRGSTVLLPHGDTMLLPGDVLVVALEVEARGEVARLVEPPSGAGRPDSHPG